MSRVEVVEQSETESWSEKLVATSDMRCVCTYVWLIWSNECNTTPFPDEMYYNGKKINTLYWLHLSEFIKYRVSLEKLNYVNLKNMGVNFAGFVLTDLSVVSLVLSQ